MGMILYVQLYVLNKIDLRSSTMRYRLNHRLFHCFNS